LGSVRMVRGIVDRREWPGGWAILGAHTGLTIFLRRRRYK
jgi:hypothetical protein